jgi:hypothetical protein
MKLNVVSADRVHEIVPQISRYSNTQNKVTLADFSSNHPFHIAVEKVTRSMWAPAVDGSGQETRWFYERARGQYTDALGDTPLVIDAGADHRLTSQDSWDAFYGGDFHEPWAYGVPELLVENVGTTAKTYPDFAPVWERLMTSD